MCLFHNFSFLLPIFCCPVSGSINGILLPFSSRLYTPFDLYFLNLPFSSISRRVRSIWQCGFPSPLSCMASVTHCPISTNFCAYSLHASFCRSLSHSAGSATSIFLASLAPIFSSASEAACHNFVLSCHSCGAFCASMVSVYTTSSRLP